MLPIKIVCAVQSSPFTFQTGKKAISLLKSSLGEKGNTCSSNFIAISLIAMEGGLFVVTYCVIS
jgi:hypothetical protein